MIPGFVAHLWQSTLFVGAVWLLTLALRKNPARVRYSLWFIASAKFLIPFSMLVGIGALLPRRAAAPSAETGWVAVAERVRPLVTIPTVGAEVTLTATGANRTYVASAAFFLWFCGFAAISICWAARWKRIGELRSRATPVRARKCIESGVPIMSVPGLVEPGVFGIFRPILLLPEGIGARLNDAQLEAILAHELCHVRRRDNLTATIHMAVQAAFWFHPLVWWLGARLVAERERACDEEVLRLGNKPQVYAAGILNVCRLYMESPLACVAGVTGSDLKRRIEVIMANRVGHRLNRTKKFLLASAGSVALAGPIAIGLVSSPPTRAQAPSSRAFEVASVKPTKPGTRDFHFRAPNHGIDATNIPLDTFILSAYNLNNVQLTGGPDWIHNEHYDIVAKAPANTANDETSQMLQTLLADRFKLITHRETRVLPVLALVLAKGGPKFSVAKETRPGDGDFKLGRGRLSGQAVTMQDLADMLVRQVDRIVLDKTRLIGKFDINLQWTPDVNAATGNDREVAPDPNGPGLATALSEQLGLRFEATKAPVSILVIDHVERPTAN